MALETKLMLITLEKQLIYFPGKKTLRNLDINDMVFLFNKKVKNLFLIEFLKKQLHLMIETLRGLTKMRNSSF